MKKEINRSLWLGGMLLSLSTAAGLGWIYGKQCGALCQLESVSEVEPVKPEPVVSKPVATAPDFSVLSGKQRKTTFFDYIGQAIDAENQRVAELNQQLAEMQQQPQLTESQQALLQKLAKKYRVKQPKQNLLSDKELISRLRYKIQPVPKALAQVQAANESAWGTSRFAEMGNNYFGQWCFVKGCGLVPENRSPGAKHEVASFRSAQGSVASYILNLNRHAGYRDFRKIRACVQERGELASGWTLAGGLVSYSTKRFVYVDILRSMIRSNRLEPKTVTEAEQNCLALYAPKPPKPEPVPEPAPELNSPPVEAVAEAAGETEAKTDAKDQAVKEYADAVSELADKQVSEQSSDSAAKALETVTTTEAEPSVEQPVAVETSEPEVTPQAEAKPVL